LVDLLFFFSPLCFSRDLVLPPVFYSFFFPCIFQRHHCRILSHNFVRAIIWCIVDSPRPGFPFPFFKFFLSVFFSPPLLPIDQFDDSWCVAFLSPVPANVSRLLSFSKRRPGMEGESPPFFFSDLQFENGPPRVVWRLEEE